MQFVKRGRLWARVLLAIALLGVVPRLAVAQTPAGAGLIQGVASTAPNSTPLPGVTVTLIAEPGDRDVGVSVTDADGAFQFPGVAVGRYRLHASLPGFDEVVRNGLVVSPDSRLDVALEIPFAVQQRSDAVAAARTDPTTGDSRESVSGHLIDVAPVKGDDFQALLPLLPGVVRGQDGRINMKGGRPTQTGLQLSQAYISDPSTGDAGFDLPIDAVDSVDVMPNPYAAEYGRFSAGVARIETRKGFSTWRTIVNNFIPVPCLKICDGESLGVRAFDPRLLVGGPLVKDRLLLSTSVQAHWQRIRVPGLPRGQNNTGVASVAAFTRLDWRVGDHDVKTTLALFPRNMTAVNINTFTPANAAPSFKQRGYNFEVVDSKRFSPTALLDSAVNFKQFNVRVDGTGDQPSAITPEGTSGTFFNRQERRSHTLQWLETFSTVRHAGGDHLLKVGLDVLRLGFDGTSQSRPVDVRRTDGSLSQRLEYGGPTTQHVETTDAAVFGQDGWRVNDRVLLELGLRLDHNGVIGRNDLSPRVGAVLGLLPDGRGILRGGTGLFYERTPLLAGAFESLDVQTVRRFAPDGSQTSTTRDVNTTTSPLLTASGRVWNLDYDHRVSKTLFLRVNHLERRGRHELIVNPTTVGGGSVLELTSAGRSSYRETEATVRYDGEGDREVTVSYVRAHSEGDLNAFDTFFGNFRNPIVRSNSSSITNVDVPNRLVALGVLPFRKWMVAPLVEVRSGFPYSVLDQEQNFVGIRNLGGRFPRFVSVDLSINRVVELRGRHVRIGFKANHILNNFVPRDVQANLGSPAFGTFYNSIVPRVGLTFEFRP